MPSMITLMNFEAQSLRVRIGQVIALASNVNSVAVATDKKAGLRLSRKRGNRRNNCSSSTYRLRCRARTTSIRYPRNEGHRSIRDVRHTASQRKDKGYHCKDKGYHYCHCYLPCLHSTCSRIMMRATLYRQIRSAYCRKKCLATCEKSSFKGRYNFSTDSIEVK